MRAGMRRCLLLLAVSVVILVAAPAGAQTYSLVSPDGTVYFTNLPTRTYARDINEAAARYAVPERLICAVIRAQSGFQPRAVARSARAAERRSRLFEPGDAPQRVGAGLACRANTEAISKSMWAAVIDVMSLVSHGGETSTRSAPTRFKPAMPRMISITCQFVSPPISGTPVPGAHDGSMPSMSNVK